MTKEPTEVIAEVWQLLVEFIPRKEQATAAEQLIGYLENIVSKQELLAITDLDSDLSEAYTVYKEEEYVDEDDYEPEY